VKLGIEGNQRGRRVGWMNDVTWSAAEDRMELVLARGREALVSAILQAGESIAVIPAPGALADITGQSAGVANLRRSDAFGGFRKHRVVFANLRVVTQRVERNQPADLNLPGLCFHFVEPANRLQIDQHVRRNQALFHHPE
jgi:hypothetical protein